MCCCGRRRFGRWPSRGASAMPTARSSDGTLRVRFGEVEARGVALTPAGPATLRRGDGRTGPGRGVGATTSPPPTRTWRPAGLAYYHGGDPSKPVVYEDFLPASAAGIFRSNLDTDTQAAETADDSGLQPATGWPARSATTFTIPTSSTRKSHHHDHRSDIPLPTAEDLRARVRDALQAVGSRRSSSGEPGARRACTASTPDHRRRAVHRRRDHARAGRRRDRRSRAGVYDVAHHPGAGARRAGGPARRAARRAQGRPRRRWSRSRRARSPPRRSARCRR